MDVVLLVVVDVVVTSTIQTAYSAADDEIENVEIAGRDIPAALAHVAPAAGCAVHQPSKV